MTQTQATKAVRWFAQDDKARLRLQAMGVRRANIYEAKDGETWDKIRMKPGEGLGVAGGLRAFGGKVAIKKAIEHFHGQGAVIIDCDTGQDSKTHGVAMFDDATGPCKPTSAYDRLSKDEALDARRQENGQMRKLDARAIWFTEGLRIAEKIKLTGWSKGALYAAFKKSNGATGRPPKHPIT